MYFDWSNSTIFFFVNTSIPKMLLFSSLSKSVTVLLKVIFISSKVLLTFLLSFLISYYQLINKIINYRKYIPIVVNFPHNTLYIYQFFESNIIISSDNNCQFLRDCFELYNEFNNLLAYYLCPSKKLFSRTVFQLIVGCIYQYLC